MKIIIGQTAFIVKFKYSKHLSKRQYEIACLEDKLNELKAIEEGKPFEQSNAMVLKRNQRLTSCYIMVGDKDVKGMSDIAIDVAVVNHPKEEFERSEGRKRAFEKDLDDLFGSPLLMRYLNIADADSARKQFVDGFNAERGKVVVKH